MSVKLTGGKNLSLLHVVLHVTSLDLSSRVHIASFVTLLLKYLKYSTFFPCFLSIVMCIVGG